MQIIPVSELIVEDKVLTPEGSPMYTILTKELLLDEVVAAEVSFTDSALVVTKYWSDGSVEVSVDRD